MIQIDIDKPKTCAECLMSCRDSFYEIYCRNDMKKHEPFDKDCPLKEVPTGKWNDYYTSQKGNDVFNCTLCSATFIVIQGSNKMNYCPNCGAKMVEPQEREDKE